MGFLNPWLLLGLGGIAVPILIHLLNRFRHRRIEWAAMELLRRAIVIRSRRIRIEDLLLLALRCLAVLLIALAMARPTLTTAGAKWFGAEQQVGAVIVLDGSYSMGYRPGVGSRFDRAQETVRDLKGALAPGDPISVVVAGNRPRVLLRSTGFDDRRLEKVLKEASPLAEPLNVESALDVAATLVRETKAPAREVYVVTDAQAVTWEHLSEKSRRALSELAGDARIFLLPTPPDSSENVGLAGLSLGAGSLRQGTTARFVAEVRNVGRLPQDRVVVSLLAGDKPVDQRIIDRLGPGETTAVPLFVRFQESGHVRLTARVGQDALEADNVRHVVARVRDQVRVLLVDGDPSDRPYRSETAYVATALVPKGPAVGQPSLAVDTVAWMELPARRLDLVDVVVLANVPDLRQAQVEELANFVEEGGGLLVFLGDKVNPALMGARMQRGGVPLLPGEVKEEVGPPADAPDGRPIAISLAEHPLARALGTLPQDLVGEARIVRFMDVAIGPQGRSVLGVGGTGSPLVAEKALGRGKVVLVTTSADRAWTSLPVHPAYPIFLHEAMTYLTTRAHERPFVVGEPVVLPLPSRSVETSVVFRAPDGSDLAVQVTEREGRRVAQYEQTDRPGFYEMKHAQAPGPVVVAANVDPRESDVRSLGAEGLATAMAGLPVRILPPGENVAAAVRESRVGRELWRMLMLAGLAVLALEAYLAWRFSREIGGGEPVTADTGGREGLGAGREAA